MLHPDPDPARPHSAGRMSGGHFGGTVVHPPSFRKRFFPAGSNLPPRNANARPCLFHAETPLRLISPDMKERLRCVGLFSSLALSFPISEASSGVFCPAKLKSEATRPVSIQSEARQRD